MNIAHLSATLMACLLSACVSYSPRSLEPGASVQAIAQAMGPPTSDSVLPDGGHRLEYARGPYGKHTYMLEIDAHGQLLRWDQVLTEPHFNAIQAGMSSTEVLAQIGHASEQRYIGWQNQTVWAYRYETQFCQWFQVGLDPQGKVVDTSYGVDPLCDAGDSRDGP